MSTTLKEAERLYSLGFAILWIKPKSKAPVESRWTTGPRKDWPTLKKSYKPGYNLGVRLGTPSNVGGKYLAVIDIDVKSTEKIHQTQALKAVKELFPNLPENVVQVMSGRGNGSSHIYIVTQKPAQPSKRKVSVDKVKVMMPSAAVNQAQKELLSTEDLNEGWRMRPAWEIAVMGEGQQVVLPPSTHPDSGRAYAWKVRVEKQKDLIEVAVGHKQKDLVREATEDWQPEEYDLTFSPLPEDIIQNILYADVEDRSATIFKVVIAMVREGLTDRQIMSVLTDQNYELGKASFDHAKTTSRGRAANWVFNYTIKKARKEVTASIQFDDEVETESLTDEEAAVQTAELMASHDWKDQIERYGLKGMNAGKPQKTLKNLVLILENDVASTVFKRNLFSNVDAYGHDAPWGGKAGHPLTDDDAVLIKKWFADRFRFEPDLKLIYEAISVISLKNGFHPVREYIEALEWDGVIRVDTWLKKYVNATGPEPYLSEVSRKILLAMVARVFTPGCKFDYIPVLEGAQGIGKSSAARILAGDAWFADNLPDLRSADARLNLHGKWVVEMAELANLKMGELETIKAYIASQSDRVRAPYGRKAVDIKRQSIFLGTTNESTYLKDRTGNRRYWPVAVGQCDFKGLKAVRDQLFAEAYFIFLNCEENLWLENETAKSQAVAQQMERVGEDEESIMAEQLHQFIETEAKKHETERFNFSRFSMSDLFQGFGPFNDRRTDMRTLVLVGRVLKTTGFTKYIVNGHSRWRKEKTPPTVLKVDGH